MWDYVAALGPEGHAVSLIQAARDHNIHNHVVFVKHCEESAVSAKAVGVFSSNSRSSD